MSTTIQETINRLRELDGEASPAPWWVGDTAWGHHAILCEYGESPEIVIDACFEGERLADKDPSLQLIVQARNSLPVLLAEIGRLKAENAKAWEEGRKEGQYIGRQLERTGYGLLYKNPYEEDKK